MLLNFECAEKSNKICLLQQREIVEQRPVFIIISLLYLVGKSIKKKLLLQIHTVESTL